MAGLDERLQGQVVGSEFFRAVYLLQFLPSSICEKRNPCIMSMEEIGRNKLPEMLVTRYLIFKDLVNTYHWYLGTIQDW
jgi:hypothetical protein